MDIVKIIDAIWEYFDELSAEKRRYAIRRAWNGNFNDANIANIEAEFVDNVEFRHELRDILMSLK